MTEVGTVLLAGGRSSRYPDGDKALAEVGGKPMCRRAVGGLPGAELIVNCRVDQRPALAEALEGMTPRFAIDPVPDRGPLAGLVTALRVTAADRVVAVACDMPLFDRQTAERLLAALDDADTAVVDTDDTTQPLGAAYRVDAARQACETTLACGSRRLVDALDRVDVTTVDADPRAIRNCNEPGEVTVADDALRGRTAVQ
jgi:molybdopterin-guanine dinucleotide biosynthesis protein A